MMLVVTDTNLVFQESLSRQYLELPSLQSTRDQRCRVHSPEHNLF